MDYPVHDRLLAAVAEHVLHEGFGAQMRVGKSRPLNVSFDQLVPCPMANGGVIPASGAQMHHVLHSCFLGIIQ